MKLRESRWQTDTQYGLKSTEYRSAFHVVESIEHLRPSDYPHLEEVIWTADLSNSRESGLSVEENMTLPTGPTKALSDASWTSRTTALNRD